MRPKVLEVVDLSVTYRGRDGVRSAVKGASLELHEGEVMGLVGESGSGKTSIGLSALGLLPKGNAVASGSVRLEGEEVLAMPTRRLSQLLGVKASLIPQSPMTALTPVLTIGDQFAECIRVHKRCRTVDARDAAIQALAQVGIPDGPRILKQYPHQVSGGTAQRILTAMALVHTPRLVVADEPTSALDATVQRQILELLALNVKAKGVSLLLISHDFGVVAALADTVTVMYRGHLVEQGPLEALIAEPAHPYTMALLAAAKGEVPAKPKGVMLGPRDGGCPYAPLCPTALSACLEEMPKMIRVEEGHKARCIAVNRVQGAQVE